LWANKGGEVAQRSESKGPPVSDSLAWDPYLQQNCQNFTGTAHG